MLTDAPFAALNLLLLGQLFGCRYLWQCTHQAVNDARSSSSVLSGHSLIAAVVSRYAGTATCNPSAVAWLPRRWELMFRGPLCTFSHHHVGMVC